MSPTFVSLTVPMQSCVAGVPFGFNFLLSDKAGGGVDGTGAGKMGELMALVGVEHQGLMAHGAVKMGPFSRKSAIK